VVALEEGQRVHHHIIQSGLEADVFVGSSLVDMYAKCGSLEMFGQFSIRCYFKMWLLGAP
jgi:hypothetical protein